MQVVLHSWAGPAATLQNLHSGLAMATCDPVEFATLGRPLVCATNRDGSWHQNRQRDMSDRVLRGTTVGFIGYGAIARQSAVLCKAMEMRVAASLGRLAKWQQLTYRSAGSGDPEGGISEQCFALDDLPQVVGEFDWIVLGLRMDAINRHLVDASLLARCKPGAVLLNPARGGLIDDAALIAALKEGRLGGAALDVYHTAPLPADDPLRSAPAFFCLRIAQRNPLTTEPRWPTCWSRTCSGLRPENRC